MSRCLTERSIDHVVLERGEVANSWKTERWDSLRLLTPNWQSRLPGYRYEGDDPDGYRTMPETIAFLERYAQVISAPVRTQNDGDSRAAQRRGLHRHDRPRRMAQPGGGAGERRVQHPQRARFRAGASARDRGAHADAVPQPRPARAGWRARGRCLGHGRAARRRDPALRAPGHARRGRAHPHAAALSRPRHPVVDGYRGRARPALRRGRRPRPRAQRAVAAARRLSRLAATST